MQLIARTCLEVKFSSITMLRRQVDIQRIRYKLISTFIRSVCHRVVKIQIESVHGIRDSHIQYRLMDNQEFSLIVPVHLNRRIKILGRGRVHSKRCNQRNNKI